MLKILDHLEEWIVILLMAGATLIIFLSVAHRYGVGVQVLYPYLSPINMAWAQELCIIMFVWMAKFGAAYGVRTGIHVGVDVMINRLKDETRGKFVVLGLLAGMLFTGTVGTLGARFVWENGMHHAVFKFMGMDTGDLPEGPTTPDLEWPTWIVYLAVPLGSYLMCFRFLQVAVGFIRTGELPHHDHGHVEGVEEETLPEKAAQDINWFEMKDDLHPHSIKDDGEEDKQ